MILIIGRLHVSRQDDFMVFAREAIASERQQPGCIGFDILHDLNEPNTFVMLERWQDRTALNRHLESLEFAHNEKRMNSFLEGEAEWEEYEI